MTLSLSTLCVVLGLAMGLSQLYGLLRPQAFAAAVRKFPRSLAWGWALMLLATAWFLYNLSQEAISDFASWKEYLYAGFAGIGIGACIFVHDFLAVRGLAVLLLLLARLMVDSGRPYLGHTSWALVIQVWAYVLVIAGMWLTVSPWRLRDLLNYATANEKRIKTGCAARLGFGLLVLALGLTVFRTAALAAQ